MESHTASTETITSREPGLLFVDVSATNVMPKLYETDLGGSGQIDSSFGQWGVGFLHSMRCGMYLMVRTASGRRSDHKTSTK